MFIDDRVREIFKTSSGYGNCFFQKFFHTTVDYATESGSYRDFTKDISNGGVFIETRNPHSVKDEISMTFFHPEYKKRIKIQGVIVRIDEKVSALNSG